MLNKAHTEIQLTLESLDVTQVANHDQPAANASTNARRMRRQRRNASGCYRPTTGWTIGMW